jgi:hypothetical protein
VVSFFGQNSWAACMEQIILFTEHAKLQMLLRGAQQSEVVQTIQSTPWEPAKRGKFKCRMTFNFNQIAPANNQHYRLKTVEPIFAQEADQIVVITVKVYYHN